MPRHPMRNRRNRRYRRKREQRVQASRRVFRLEQLIADLPEKMRRAKEMMARIDTTGMTRPRRHPVERAWLEAQEQVFTFIECDVHPRELARRQRKIDQHATHPELTVPAASARVEHRRLIVTLKDGREVSGDLTRYPNFNDADEQALQRFELHGDGDGVWWPKLGTVLSVYGVARDAGLLDENGVLNGQIVCERCGAKGRLVSWGDIQVARCAQHAPEDDGT